MRPYPRRSSSAPPHARARERVLSEWRGIDLAPLEKAAARSARPVEEILPRVLAGLRLDRRQAEAEIVKVWNNTMDPGVTRHAQPTGLRNGTLFVTVDSNAWLSEIVRYRRREILERLRHSFGPQLVQRVSYRVG